MIPFVIFGVSGFGSGTFLVSLGSESLIPLHTEVGVFAES